MKLHLSLCGTYPRKEELVKATWNFDKGLLSVSALRAAQDEQSREVLAIQHRLGFEPVTDGLLAWQDLFRPLVETSPGFEVGGVTRLFETNKFYRQPILNQAPSFNWNKLEPFFPHHRNLNGARWKAILPSPYWFLRVTKDEVYHDERKLGLALAGHVNEVAKRVEAAGATAIQFNDPCLLYESTPDLALARDLFSAATKGVTAPTLANFPNGDASPHLDFLAALPVSGVGIDFVETLIEEVPKGAFAKPLVAQVVDSQESHLEGAADIRDLVDRIERRLKPRDLTATHTWDLDFVPHEVAVKKLEVLAELLPSRSVTA